MGSAQRSAIDGHVRLLLAWNQSINLTAIRDPEAVAIGHVVDSLTALPVMRERGLRRFVDLGSGGGFPGLPVAAALEADAALLVDSVAKKVRFLDAAAAAVGMAGTVATFTGRAEHLAATPSTASVGRPSWRAPSPPCPSSSSCHSRSSHVAARSSPGSAAMSPPK